MIKIIFKSKINPEGLETPPLRPFYPE
jgi:hypothetical protein